MEELHLASTLSGAHLQEYEIPQESILSAIHFAVGIVIRNQVSALLLIEDFPLLFHSLSATERQQRLVVSVLSQCSVNIGFTFSP
jgi:hypothetical protein